MISTAGVNGFSKTARRKGYRGAEPLVCMGSASGQQVSLDTFAESHKPTKSWLYEQYWRQEKTTRDLREMLDCSGWAIKRLFEKHGVPRRNSGATNVDTWLARKRFKNEQWLRKQYYGNEKTAPQIAKEIGTTRDTIIYWMEQHGVDRRDQSEHQRKGVRLLPVRYNDTKTNYYLQAVCTNRDNSRDNVKMHRLQAVAHFGYDAVVGNDVHHTTGIKWLNLTTMETDIPELEPPLIEPVDHIAHGRGRHGGKR